MSVTTDRNGRLGNQIIRNLAVSIIAEKHDLYVEYSSYNLIMKLGIDLFIGKRKLPDTIPLTDGNYLDTYARDSLNSNLDPNNDYFQRKDIMDFLYKYIHSDVIKANVTQKNPFRNRYNANNDVIIHIRLGDVVHYNPGIKYYLHALSTINFENMYICTDDANHSIVRNILEKYPNTTIIQYNVIETIQFATTCKHIILSHGSFSAVIGYLAFFSDVHYPEYDKTKHMWYGDMFSIDTWIKHDINVYNQHGASPLNPSPDSSKIISSIALPGDTIGNTDSEESVITLSTMGPS